MRVRGQVAEAGDEQDRQRQPEPRREREGNHAASEQEQRQEHAAPGSAHPAGDDECRGHRAGTERARDEPADRVLMPVGVGQGRRERVHRI